MREIIPVRFVRGYICIILSSISNFNSWVVNMTRVDDGVIIIGPSEQDVQNKETTGDRRLQRHLIVFAFILLLGCAIVYGYYSAMLLQRKVNDLHAVVESISTNLRTLGVSNESREQLFSLLRDISNIRERVNATFRIKSDSIPEGPTNASRIMNDGSLNEGVKKPKKVITFRVVTHVHLLANNDEWFVAAIQNFSKNLQSPALSVDFKLPDVKAPKPSKNTVSQSFDGKNVGIRDKNFTTTASDVWNSSKSATTTPGGVTPTGSITTSTGHQIVAMQKNTTLLQDIKLQT